MLGPEEEPVVAMATSMAVICVGGPQPWVLDSSSFFRSCKTVLCTEDVVNFCTCLFDAQ